MSRDTRGYCGHYSNFSRASLDPVNVPVCIFRNPLRYDVDSCKPCGQGIVTAGSAHEQALRYAYNGRDAYIPNEMLQRTILEDQKSLKHSNFQSPSSSLVGARFWEKDYLIYFTGKNFNSLTLKETTALDKTGFNLKVSEAMPLIEVHAVSPAANITKQTHILSRSAYDVFHAHMVSSDDLSSSLQKRCSSSALLEPVTRWKMPCVIADMSTSSSGAGRASVLCSDGQLFRWSTRGGMRGCNGGRSVVDQLTADSLNGSTPVHSMRVECSLHPQIDHLVFNGQLLLYDAREPGRAHSVYVSSDPPSSPVIDSVSQFRGDAHKLLLSCGGSAMVLDTRHTRSPLQKRPLPFAQTVVRRIDHVEWSDSVDHQTSELFIGANQGGSLLLSHCIESAATESGVGDRGESQSVGLLPAASVLGVSSNMRWDCSSFPVITSDSAAAAQQHTSSSSTSASLTGFDVISCADSGRSLLLVHQNSRGDVYAQRVSWGSNQALHHLHRGSRGPPPGSRGRASQPAPLSQSSSAGSSLDLKSLIGAFSQPGPSSSSVQSSSSSSSALIASRQQQLESVSRLAPIQLNLLCGVRAIHSGGVFVYPRPSSSYALHQQQAPLLSFDMLTFDPARMRRDYLSSRSESDRQQRRRGRGDTEVEDVEQALLLLSGGGLEELVERVSEHPLSLLEVWRMVNRDSDEDGEVGGVVSLAALRRYLTSSSAAVFSEVSEVLVPLPAGLRSAHRSNGLKCQCYQNAMRIASAARSNVFRSSSYGSSGAYSEVVCEERGCPMGYLYCYRRRNQAAGGTGTNSSSNNRGGSMGPQRGKTGSSSSSGNSGSGTLGCIYKAHPLQSTTSAAAALEAEEVDLFMTQQSQPPSSQPSFLMSPLAAAIGGGFGVSHSQSTVYSHQSILNTQNTVTVKEETKKKKGSGVTSDLINSLSDSWDALPVA